MSKMIKVLKSGIETEVSDDYYDTYVSGGWFIEIPKPVVKKAVKKVAKKEVK